MSSVGGTFLDQSLYVIFTEKWPDVHLEDDAEQMKNIFDQYIQDAMALHYIWKSLGPRNDGGPNSG